MAKEDKKLAREARKAKSSVSRLNDLVGQVMDRISPSGERQDELNNLMTEIDDVIYDDIKSLTKFTGDDISTYLVKLFNEDDRKVAAQNSQINSIEDIFGNESSGIFTFFQDRYKNQNILYEDLKVICGQLYELKEALNATRDAIVTSDDLTKSVSRNLLLKSTSDETAKESYRSVIENMEKRFGILQKVKDHIIPNTLQFGRYYVYTAPHAKLFEEHQRKIQQKNKYMVSMESTTVTEMTQLRKDNNFEFMGSSDDILTKAMNDILGHVEVCNESMGIPILENVDMSPFIDSAFDKQVQKITKSANKLAASPDGTLNVGKDKTEDFSTINGCYIKLLDPRKVIPIKVLDQTLGYYYIHQLESQTNRTPFSSSLKLSPNATSTPKDVENAFLSKITDKIVKSFDKKYLENNEKFKELILNALIYNDVYKKQLKFQFIPVDQMTEFHVNKDEDGEGTSVILPSLFYAKLFFAILIFKIITILSKSNDTRVYYVKQSGIDTNVISKVQDAARDLKSRQINFMDLMNYGNILSKVGHAKDIFMPVGRSGEKAIDFDILAGQDVQLNTELLEMLRTAFINATGVPSVIMDYVNQADYAKTLVMANAKFMNRVVNHQLDFNFSITELYKKLMRFSTTIPDDVTEEFEFALATPKALVTANMSDLLSSADQTIQFMVKSLTGENSSPSDDDNEIKDILYAKLAQEMLPMLPWNFGQQALKESRLELTRRKQEAKVTTKPNES